MNGSMFIENAAVRIMAEQAAFDYGYPSSHGIDPIDHRAVSRAQYMFWTGAIDIEATEVFEGDIVEKLIVGTYVTEGYGKIVWRHDLLQYAIEYWIGVNQYFREIRMNGSTAYLRVVGNIYEHPNLLHLTGI